MRSTLNSIQSGFARAGDAVSSFGNMARSGLGRMGDLLKPLMPESMEAATGKITGFFGAMGSGLRTGLTGVGKLGKGVVQFTSAAIRKFGELTARVAEFAASLGSRAIQQGLRSAGQAVQQTTSGATGAIRALTSTQTNLTLGIEAEGAAHAQAARRIGVNYGFLGRDLQTFARQAAGMAQSLNISDEVAGQAVRGFREAGSEFRDIGLNNANMVARFTSVIGVSGDLMRNTLLQARREFGFAGPDLRTLIHSTVSFGRASGDVNGAMQNMSTLLQQVRQQSVQAGLSMDSRHLAEYAASVNRTATAFFAVTQNSDEARTMATQLSQSLLTAQRQMGDLFAGTAEDIPQLAEGLGVATGDVQRAFELMRSGPAGFTAGLAQMVQSARANGRDVGPILNQLRARMDQALGPEQTNQMISFFGRATTEQLSTMTTANRSTEDLAAMARQGFSTGRTMQDAFERMQQSFISGFRSISRRAIGPFMRDTQHAFREFNSTLRGVVERGGPLGAFVERLSLAHQIGATAFLPPDARPFAMAMGTMFESVGPGLTALGSLGFRLSSLANPLVLIGAAVAYLAIQFGAIFRRTHSVEGAFTELQARISTFATSAVQFIERLVPAIIRMIPSIVQALSRMLQTLIPAVARIGAAIFEGLVNIGAQLLRWAIHYDWGAFIGRVLRGVVGALSQAWSRIRETVQGAVQSVGRPSAAAGAGGAGAGGGGGAIAQLSPVISGVISAFSALGERTGGLEGILTSIQRVMAYIVPVAISLGASIGRLASDLLPVVLDIVGDLAAELGPVVTHLGELAANLVRQLTPVIRQLMEALRPVIPQLIRLATGALDILVPAVGRLIGVVGPLISNFVTFAGNLTEDLMPVFRRVVSIATDVATYMGDLGNVLLRELGPVFRRIINGLEPFVDIVGEIIHIALPPLQAAFTEIIAAIRRMADAVMWLISRIPGLNQARALTTELSTAAAAARSRENERRRDAEREASAQRRLVDMQRLRQAGLMDDLRGTSSAFIAQMAHAVRQGASVTQARTFAYQQTASQQPTQAPGAPAGAMTADQVREATTRGASEAQRLVEGLWRNNQLSTEQRQQQWDQYAQSQARALTQGVQQGRITQDQATAAMRALNEAARAARARVTEAPPVPEASRVTAAVQRMTVRRATEVTTQLTAAATQAGEATTRIAQAALSAEASLTRVQTVGIAAARAVSQEFDQMRARILAMFTELRGQGAGETGLFTTLGNEATAMFTRISTGATEATTSIITAFRTNVTDLSTEISNLFTNVIGSAVSNAFTDSFNSVLMYIQNTFIRRQMDMFNRLVLALQDMFRRMLVAIVTATDVMFRYVAERAAEVQTLGRQALGVMSSIRAAADMARTAAGTIDARAEHLGAREAGLNDVYNAIMHPDWYERDYKALFVQKMDTLISAVQTAPRGVGAGTGGRTASQALAAINTGLGQRTAMPGNDLVSDSGTPTTAAPLPTRSTRTAGARR